MDKLFYCEGCVEVTGEVRREKKKIAVVLATEPNFGGGHQYAMLIAECLVKNTIQNYELVAICCNPFWNRWCRKNQIKCINGVFSSSNRNERIFNYMFPFAARIYNRYMTSMGKMLRKEKIDILFSAQQLFYIPNFDLKIIAPVHDLMHKYEPDFPEVKEHSCNSEKCQIQTFR